ncbi:hypothetical protein GCM10009116_09860 [Brevundimonas basaltis]|uniref:Uncharacterized protein n=1 Tax=Brevundimonas basaltis TaxID=472166 RepID=A0A7W8HYL8_9CAUL|nr:hypothetical protein [Brevundimonas basaltis]MBB5292089.1 hypothetical protein [Brevundimonas basaltis]
MTGAAKSRTDAANNRLQPWCSGSKMAVLSPMRAAPRGADLKRYWSAGPARWPRRGGTSVLLAILACLAFSPGARAEAGAGAAPVLNATPPSAASGDAGPTPEEQARVEADRLEAARLEAARRARSTAEQQIALERRRLAAYALVLSAAESRLDAAAGDRDVEAEAALGLRQQAVEAHSRPAVADAVYDELRTELRATRSRLDATLRRASRGTDLPPAPVLETNDLAPGDSLSALRTLQAALQERRDRLAVRQHADDRTEARLLLGRLTLLNQARLDLLPHLSTGKRRALTSFSPAAWNQVSAEFEHLALIIRYHAFVLIDAARQGVLGRDILSASVLLAASTVMWVLAFVVFAIWRTTARRLFPVWEQRLQAKNLATLRASPEFRLKLLRLFMSVRGPLEWLVLLFVLRGFLPTHVRALLEVQILGLIVGWLLIAAVATRLLDALFGAGGARTSRSTRALGPLRLRSMRLVSNVSVGFILVLTLTARLVGKGAFYHWVLAIGWPAAALTLMLLVAWWREVVFEQLARQRRPGGVQRWMLANRTGRYAPVAALAATVDVVVRGLARSARTVGSRFVSVRRTLAFLFRQELNRADRSSVSDLIDLPPAPFDSLSPTAAGEVWITTRLQPMLDRLAEPGAAGLIALVGEWGSGKSAALDHLYGRLDDVRRMTAVDLMKAPDRRASRGDAAVMLVDDVEALVRFDVGGLAAFDRCIDRARRSADGTLWVLSIDSAAWPLISRLRHVRTLFRTVIEVPRWTDTAVAELLGSRTAQAGLRPLYDRMIEDAGSMDEIDLAEAVEAKSAAFMLLLWDASAGNPGVALHLWRSVLGVGPDGRVFVRPLHPLAEATIERLPLEALFVYRAVLRQPDADGTDVAAATRLPAGMVADILSAGVREGHLLRTGETHRISWDWFRPLTRSLVRHHLGDAP